MEEVPLHGQDGAQVPDTAPDTVTTEDVPLIPGFIRRPVQPEAYRPLDGSGASDDANGSAEGIAENGREGYGAEEEEDDGSFVFVQDDTLTVASEIGSWRDPRAVAQVVTKDRGVLHSRVDPQAWVAAREYLERGWKLFLLPGDGTKKPAANCDFCRDAGAGHDKEACECLLCHGFYAATSDPARLSSMWMRIPGGVLALRTGAASGVVVVDAEGRPDAEGGTSGVEVLDSWEEWSGGFPLPATLRARTPSGGVHLFYATGTDETVRSAARVLPGVDVRGRGGYVALPPGVRGERTWITEGPPDPVPPTPEMLTWLRAARGTRARVWTDGAEGAGTYESRLREKWAGYDFDRMLREGAPRGVQDEFLNDLIFRMVRHGGITDPELMFARVWPLVQAWDQDPTRPWTGFHVSKKIAHVLDTVTPADALPAWTPRRESREEIVVTWNGNARVIAVVPEELDRREGREVAEDPLAELRHGEPPAPAPAPAPSTTEEGTVISVDFSTRGADTVAIRGAVGVVGGGVDVVDLSAGSVNGSAGGARDGVGGAVRGPGGGVDGTGSGAGGTGRSVGYGGPTGDGVPGTEGMHDTGNANRFIRLHGHDVRWVEDEGVWLVWNGVRWRRDRTRTVEGRTVDVMTDLARHAREVGGEEGRLWVRHMRASYSAGKRSAMLLNAQRVPGITVTSDMLDTDPWSLVVGNGVLDLRTGKLGPGRREDLNTRCAAVSYDPHHGAPMWEAHVRTVTGGDPVMAAYLRRLAGYSLTGLTTEQAFFSLEGSGDNGKNAFIEPLMLMLGEYADTADSKLVTYGDKTHAAIVASLVGMRLIFVDEIPSGRHMDVERVKSLTGSTRMKAQFMAKDWFAFTPQLKLWLAGNAQPPIKDTSDGIWRRMHRVLFNAKIPEGSKVKGYSEILFEREAPGILNWALAGLAEWVATGRLGMPDEVKESVRQLQEESDHIAAFLQDCVEVTGKMGVRNQVDTDHGRGGAYALYEWEGDWIPNTRLQSVYTAWCDGQGVAARERVNAVHLGRRVAAMGAVRYKDTRDGIQGRGMDGARLTVSAIQLWGAVLG